MPHISVVLDQEQLTEIDRLRIQRCPPPTRSQQLRELLETALAQGRKPKAQSKSRRREDRTAD